MVVVVVSPLHCECFSSSCLPVREDGSIVSFKHAFNNWKRCFLENWFLFACHAESSIKCEITRRRKVALLRMGILHRNLGGCLVNMNYEFVISLSLLLVGRTTPNYDLDGFCFRGDLGWHNLNISRSPTKINGIIFDSKLFLNNHAIPPNSPSTSFYTILLLLFLLQLVTTQLVAPIHLIELLETFQKLPIHWRPH